MTCSFNVSNIREVYLLGDTLEIMYTENFADWDKFQGKMALLYFLTYRVNTYKLTYPEVMSHSDKCVLYDVRHMHEKRHDSSPYGARYMAIQTQKCKKIPF